MAWASARLRWLALETLSLPRYHNGQAHASSTCPIVDPRPANPRATYRVAPSSQTRTTIPECVLEALFFFDNPIYTRRHFLNGRQSAPPKVQTFSLLSTSTRSLLSTVLDGPHRTAFDVNIRGFGTIAPISALFPISVVSRGALVR